MATEPKHTAPQLAKGVVIVIAVLTLALASLIYGTVAHSARQRFPPADPPQAMLPGNPLPEQAECTWPPYASESMACRLSSNGQMFYFTNDAQRGAIIRTSMEVEDQTIGGLISVWGPPTGVQMYAWAALVSWGSRSVFVSSHPFSPSNHVSFIRYTLEPEPLAPWTGFVSARD